MAYVIDKNGNRKFIDLDVHTTKNITIYSDKTDFMEDIYILNLYRNVDSIRTNNELVAQVRLNNEPTKEQILYWFSLYELENTDFYTIERGKMLTWVDPD